jgi:hypothetical protein
MDQVDLPLNGASHPETAWQLMLKLIRGIVDDIGLKEVAYDLDVSPSQLNHCLNERERHNVPAKWIPYFVTKAKDDDLPSFIALLRGLQVKPRKELTPEQKLEKLERALAAELGEGVREAVYERAYGEPKRRR